MRIIFFVLTIAITSLVQAQELSVENIFKERMFVTKTLDDIRPVKGKNAFVKSEEYKDIVLYDSVLSAVIDTLFSVSNLKHQSFSHVIDFLYEPDSGFLLLSSNAEQIYRYSYSAERYLYISKTSDLMPIVEGKKIRDARFSPDANRISYVNNNNLFYYDITEKQTVIITTDGSKDSIINGVPDWLYEEEFYCEKAYEWSPNGKYIAYYKFDERNVPNYKISWYDSENYPQWTNYKYTKAGEKNAEVSIYIYDVVSGEHKKVSIVREDDYYIPVIKWSPDNKLGIVCLNRLQNKLEVLLVNPSTGNTEIVYNEKETEYFHGIDNNYLVFADSGKTFIIKSERDGYSHFYRYNVKGEFLNQVTSGSFDTGDLIAIDDEDNQMYYYSKERGVLFRDVCSVSLEGSNKKIITSEEGWHNAIFSSDFETYIDEYSNVTNANRYTVIKTENRKTQNTILQNNGLIHSLEEQKVNFKEFIQVPVNDTTILNAYIIKPPEFKSRKKYPVLIYMYGGPESQLVANRWSDRDLWFYYLAQQGYIVACVDNRGTNGRGERFAKSTYLNLGKLEVEDQLAFARFLAKEKYVDANRIGTFGWSYGGYLSLLCLMQEKTPFRVGIAVAPVTHWKFYDSAYTERYMRQPKDNEQGYEAYAPLNMAENLNAKLLLVHGTADDNVHVQNSMELINELVTHDKMFELQIYPNRNHGIYSDNARFHLYKTMTRFILENL